MAVCSEEDMGCEPYTEYWDYDDTDPNLTNKCKSCSTKIPGCNTCLWDSDSGDYKCEQLQGDGMPEPCLESYTFTSEVTGSPACSSCLHLNCKICGWRDSNFYCMQTDPNVSPCLDDTYVFDDMLPYNK